MVVLRDEMRDFLMAVLPASEHVEIEALRRITGRDQLEIAGEEDLRRLFPDCELGAMPPCRCTWIRVLRSTTSGSRRETITRSRC